MNFLYFCCAGSGEDKEEPDTLGKTPETHKDEPVVTFRPDQHEVIAEIHSRYSTPRKGRKISEKAKAEEGAVQEINRTPRFAGKTPETHKDEPVVTFRPDQHQVITEVHSRHSTPRIGEKISEKGIQVPFKERGQDNQGFQGDGEQTPALPRGQSLYAYPWDKSNLKSMSIDLNQFKELDAYASKVNVRSSVEDLVRVLLQNAHSDLEKVRAFWTWICHHIEYDVEGYHNKAMRSCKPADVFRSGKSVCAGYAGLFEEMCSIAGIKCKNLSGYAKGYGYNPGQAFKREVNHAWNAVALDGRWHLLDSTWGSGTVDDTCCKFTFGYNEFYFLTHPALFINDHLPEDEKWQLLKEPLTLQQFERKVRYRPEFYKAGLLVASAGTSTIETENGKATVFIECRSPALFMFKLNKIDEHGLMTLQKNGMTLEVYPRQTGTHHLEIFAKPFDTTEKNYGHVLEYSVKCSSVDKSVCLPKDLIQPAGPSWLSEEKGILGALPTSPVIHTDDGRCVVTFTQSQDLDVFATLDSDTSQVPENIRRRHIWKTCQKNQVELKIHLPHTGSFALHIWAKKASQPGNSCCALSYIITCPNKNITWPVFPKSYGSWEEGYELVAPLAGVLPANRNIQFKLKLPGIREASVECGKTHTLTLSDEGFWEGTCYTSGSSKVTVKISKNADKMFWFVLEYQVENI